MKNTNKILLVVLLVLLSAFVATKFFRSPARESNLNTEVFRLDTARLAALEFRLPDAKEEELTLKRNDSSWTVQQGDQTAAVRTFELNNLLGTLDGLAPERIVSRKKEKWDQYQVSDTTAIHMVAYNKTGDEMAEWFIGKESGGVTYIRNADAPDIYVVDGHVRNRFANSFNEWRDRTFLNVTKALVDKLTFQYPADSSFVLEKDGPGWTINNQTADSAKIETYLNDIQFQELDGFEDDYSPSGEADITLTMEGGAQTQAVVKAWKDKGNQWILTSTLQEDVYFRDSSFVTELFRGKKWFLEAD